MVRSKEITLLFSNQATNNEIIRQKLFGRHANKVNFETKFCTLFFFLKAEYKADFNVIILYLYKYVYYKTNLKVENNFYFPRVDPCRNNILSIDLNDKKIMKISAL